MRSAPRLDEPPTLTLPLPLPLPLTLPLTLPLPLPPLSSQAGSTMGVLGNYGPSGLGASRASGVGNRQPPSARRPQSGGKPAAKVKGLAGAKLDW